MKLSTALLTVSLPLYILDQVTKWWIVLSKEEGVVHPVIPGFFNIMRVHNQGVAWGMGNGTSWAPILFLLILPVALIGISILWKKGLFPGKLGLTSYILLVAGILGNLTDRLLQGFWLEQPADASFMDKLLDGYVVDFLDVTIPFINYRWPTFNVADSCIVVAAVCLFLTSFFEEDDDKTTA